jgi:hypothetical protein
MSFRAIRKSLTQKVSNHFMEGEVKGNKELYEGGKWKSAL